MMRRVFFPVLFFLLLGCTPATTDQEDSTTDPGTSATELGTTTTDAGTTTYSNGSTKVYITKTGEKYHVGSCSYLRLSKISITLSEAVRQGYTACSVCKPPTLKAVQEGAELSCVGWHRVVGEIERTMGDTCFHEEYMDEFPIFSYNLKSC